MDHEVEKRAAGYKAASLIRDGMIVGLGTGSTAAYFIEALVQRIRQGLHIRAVASSRASAELARKGNIHVVDLNDVPKVDITVDGADEIDPLKRMIKGGGGAHVREKILAYASRELIVIVDETKCVSSLGKANLPVEILFFGSPSARFHLEERGYTGQWRTASDGSLFITENGNLLFDLHFDHPIKDPKEEHLKILQVPGVVDTGLFFDIAGRVIVGLADGSTKLL
jgi:ribose 5-phosphate isomerase A